MKRTFAIIGLAVLGVVFVVASLWVMLSGGHSARAVRTKFRIGGAMLTLSAMISLTSCGAGNEYGVSCYDPAPPPENEHRWNQGVANSELRNGDKVVLNYECRFGSEVKISLITDDEGEDRVLCSQTYQVVKGGNQLEFTIEAGDYRGRAELCVEYDKYEDGDESFWPFAGIFVAIVD
jgi:hypothetical protein